MSIQPTMLGTFKLERSENFDEWMKARGMNFAVRKLAAVMMNNLTKTIHDDGNGQYTVTNETPKKTLKWTFKLGEPFEGEMFDGKVHTIKFTVEGADMLEHHHHDGVDDEPTVYHIDGDHLVIVRHFALVHDFAASEMQRRCVQALYEAAVIKPNHRIDPHHVIHGHKKNSAPITSRLCMHD